MALGAYISEGKRLQQAAKGDSTEALILRNLDMPVSFAGVAMRQANLHHSWREELIAVGNLALVEAAQSYDPSKGDFGPFAAVQVRGAIWDAVGRDTSGGIVRSSATLHRVQAVRRAVAKLQGGVTDKEPSLEEIAQEAGLSVDAVQSLMRIQRAMLRLDQPIDAEEINGETIGRYVADDAPGPEEQALDAVELHEREELEKAVKMLPERAQIALGLRMGYPSFERVSMTDVLYASRIKNQRRARRLVGKLFQEGKASAERVGFNPEDTAAAHRGHGIPSPSAGTRTDYHRGRDSPADIWQRLTDRWRQAAEMDTRQCVGS